MCLDFEWSLSRSFDYSFKESTCIHFHESKAYIIKVLFLMQILMIS